MPWDFIIILIVLAVAVPLLGQRRIRELLKRPETTKGERMRLYISTVLSQWAAVLVILWRCREHRVSLHALGVALPFPRLAALVSVLLGGLLLANQLLGVRQIAHKPDVAGGTMAKLALRIFPQSSVERLAFFPVVATVSICEELIYRGFVQWFFQNVAGGRALVGIVGSAIFFGSAHLYQGRQGVIGTGVMGLVFSGVRAWTGGLLPCVIAHFVTDITVGLLAPSRIAVVAAQNTLTTK